MNELHHQATMWACAMTRLTGVVMMLNEVMIQPTADPAMMMVAAATMGAGQATDMIGDKVYKRDSMAKSGQHRRRMHQPSWAQRVEKKVPLTVNRVYEKHNIDAFEIETDWLQFEMDVTAALIAEANAKPKRPESPVIVATGEILINRECVCFTPHVHSNVISVVFKNESHVACWMCGRILTVDYPAFDMKVRAKAMRLR